MMRSEHIICVGCGLVQVECLCDRINKTNLIDSWIDSLSDKEILELIEKYTKKPDKDINKQ